MLPCLPFAIALSLALHAGVLFWDARKLSLPPAPPPIEASLQPPAPSPARNNAPLLKNTLIDDPALVKAVPPAPPAARALPPNARAAARRQIEAAQRKLSQHLYYPPAAVARGLEGEVRLLLTITDDGSISDVVIAASSGHALLDQAAVKAAYAMGRIGWANSREFILPVIFRLE